MNYKIIQEFIIFYAMSYLNDMQIFLNILI